MYYMSTEFHVDSSSRFLFRAWADKHTRWQMRLITIPTPRLPPARVMKWVVRLVITFVRYVCNVAKLTWRRVLGVVRSLSRWMTVHVTIWHARSARRSSAGSVCRKSPTYTTSGTCSPHYLLTYFVCFVYSWTSISSFPETGNFLCH